MCLTDSEKRREEDKEKEVQGVVVQASQTEASQPEALQPGAPQPEAPQQGAPQPEAPQEVPRKGRWGSITPSAPILQTPQQEAPQNARPQAYQQVSVLEQPLREENDLELADVAPAPAQPVEAPAAGKIARRRERKRKERERKEQEAVARYSIASETIMRIRLEERAIKTDKFRKKFDKKYAEIPIEWGEASEKESISIANRILQIDSYKNSRRRQLIIPEVREFYLAYKTKFTSLSASYIDTVNLQKDLQAQLLIKDIPVEKRKELEATQAASLKTAALKKKEMVLVEEAIKHYLFDTPLSEEAEAYMQENGSFKKRRTTSQETPLSAQAEANIPRNDSIKKRRSREEIIAGFESFKTPDAADQHYRPMIAKLWGGLSDEGELSDRERLAAVAYTENSDSINRPLRHQLPNNTELPEPCPDDRSVRELLLQARHTHRPEENCLELTNLLTGVINKSSLGVNTILHRGIDVAGLAGLLGISERDLLTADEDSLNAATETKVIKDEGFTSTGAAIGTGFDEKKVQIHILAPAHTKAIYCEPFSAFGETAKYQDDHNDAGPPVPIWDGVTAGRSIGNEAEILLQRGTSFAVEDIKVTFEDGKRKFDVILRITGQEPGEIK